MGENPKAGEPARKQPCDSVRDENIEFCQPSFAESHHQDACGRNPKA